MSKTLLKKYLQNNAVNVKLGIETFKEMVKNTTKVNK
jgi:uncharacterized Fe-S cluster-containing MiaB family protein